MEIIRRRNKKRTNVERKREQRVFFLKLCHQSNKRQTTLFNAKWLMNINGIFVVMCNILWRLDCTIEKLKNCAYTIPSSVNYQRLNCVTATTIYIHPHTWTSIDIHTHAHILVFGAIPFLTMRWFNWILSWWAISFHLPANFLSTLYIFTLEYVHRKIHLL